MLLRGVLSHLLLLSGQQMRSGPDDGGLLPVSLVSLACTVGLYFLEYT